MQRTNYIFLLIITVVASVLAYNLMTKAYADMDTFDIDQFETTSIDHSEQEE